MSSKLNSGVHCAYMRGGAAWERLRVKAKTRYTNRRYLPYYLVNHKTTFSTYGALSDVEWPQRFRAYSLNFVDN